MRKYFYKTQPRLLSGCVAKSILRRKKALSSLGPCCDLKQVDDILRLSLRVISTKSLPSARTSSSNTAISYLVAFSDPKILGWERFFATLLVDLSVFFSGHSCRSATNGSTFVARRAGM